jgi:hypothetical protein
MVIQMLQHFVLTDVSTAFALRIKTYGMHSQYIADSFAIIRCTVDVVSVPLVRKPIEASFLRIIEELITGWEGRSCNEAICRDNCDTTGGYCDVPGECLCNFGFHGENCEIGSSILPHFFCRALAAVIFPRILFYSYWYAS